MEPGESERGPRLVLLHNAMIVTMNPTSTVYRDGALVVSGDRIEAIGRSADILRDFSHAAIESLDLGGRILLPGLINTHVHSSQQLARGIGDDVDLLTWLHQRIWPYESHMTEEDSYVSTLLCGVELIRSGVTCFAEAGGQHVSGMARAVELLGLRACLAKSVMDSGEGLPANWNDSADDCIQHVAEIPYENQVVRNTRNVDLGTVTYLKQIGLLRSNLLAAHSVHLNDTEIGFLSSASVKVSHCPASAMRMLGYAPIKEMLDAGVCVSIGTDGAPSNNRMSMVDEMYLTSLINKGRETHISGATNLTTFPAELVLKMATIHGAKSVLWDNEIGSLEVGKKADMIIVNPFSWSMVPLHDCISSLVYCMRTENIDSVMCNGQWIMKDQKILNVNEGEIISQAMQASKDILKRAGINLPNRMNYM